MKYGQVLILEVEKMQKTLSIDIWDLVDSPETGKMIHWMIGYVDETNVESFCLKDVPSFVIASFIDRDGLNENIFKFCIALYSLYGKKYKVELIVMDEEDVCELANAVLVGGASLGMEKAEKYLGSELVKEHKKKLAKEKTIANVLSDWLVRQNKPKDPLKTSEKEIEKIFDFLRRELG